MTEKDHLNENDLEINKEENKNSIDPALVEEWRRASEALGMGN